MISDKIQQAHTCVVDEVQCYTANFGIDQIPSKYRATMIPIPLTCKQM